MPETVVLKVGMSCKGCVGAVERVLNKLEGVETFDIDLEQQKVTVTGDVTPAVVLEKVSKTGKPTQIWPEQVPEPAEAAPAKPASEIAA